MGVLRFERTTCVVVDVWIFPYTYVTVGQNRDGIQLYYSVQ